PAQAPGTAWQHGTSMPFLREVMAHWRDNFDWRQWESRINRHSQFLVPMAWGDIHVLVEEGSGDNPTPIILSHGWPGSFVELLELVEPLAHPERFGGSVADAFTLVIPSLPGYGFSPPPTAMVTPRQTGELWHSLMTEVFGHSRYLVHGGDMGSSVSSWLALDHPEAVLGLHLNNAVLQPEWTLAEQPPTAEEQEFLGRFMASMEGESAYQQNHGTKPQTLAYSLADSPVGLAAWILEKFQRWTVGAEDCALPFDYDHLIANLMVHWLGDPGAATWMYRYLLDMSAFTLPPGRRIEVPTGVCLFPNDCAMPPPDSWLRRSLNLVHCTRAASGGHFPGLECPQVLIDDLRAFNRLLKA